MQEMLLLLWCSLGGVERRHQCDHLALITTFLDAVVMENDCGARQHEEEHPMGF